MYSRLPIRFERLSIISACKKLCKDFYIKKRKCQFFNQWHFEKSHDTTGSILNAKFTRFLFFCKQISITDDKLYMFSKDIKDDLWKYPAMLRRELRQRESASFVSYRGFCKATLSKPLLILSLFFLFVFLVKLCENIIIVNRLHSWKN